MCIKVQARSNNRNKTYTHDEIKSKLNLGKDCYNLMYSTYHPASFPKPAILRRFRTLENRVLRITLGPERDVTRSG
jgi:hypothetical protein